MLKKQRLRQGVVDYWDLILAIGAALTVAVLGTLGQIETETLTTATLVVLAALAGVTLRERYERRKGIDEIRSLTSATLSDKPWHVLDERLSWDLLNSTDAVVSDRRNLRFLDAESVAVWEFFSGPSGGEVVEHKCLGGPMGVRVLREWPVMKETFMADANRRYRVVSTNGIWKRGDRVTWESTRRLKDFFPETEEGVTKTVLMPTDQLIMQVLWPAGLPPRNVRFERDKHEPRYLTPKIDKNGRECVSVDVGRAYVGEVINIRWEWR